MQSVTMKLDGQQEAPPDASTVDLIMAAIASDLADDPWVKARVDQLQAKFPKAPGH
jgi:hypothetical protein